MATSPVARILAQPKAKQYVMGWVAGIIYHHQGGGEWLFHKDGVTGSHPDRKDYSPTIHSTPEKAKKAAEKNQWYGKDFEVFIRVYTYETPNVANAMKYCPQPLTLLENHQGPTYETIYQRPKTN